MSTAFRNKNSALIKFVAIMVIAYAVWYVVYDLWLLPEGSLDAWLSTATASATASLLNLLGTDAMASGRIVRMSNTAGIELINGCNGLAVLSLFVGFVLAYPGMWIRRAWFIPLGIAIILGSNVLRCAVLMLLQRRSMEAFEVGHGAAGMIVFYLVVFLLWMAWARMGGKVSPSGSTLPNEASDAEGAAVGA